MVCPVRCVQASKVSFSSGAEPLMNSRMRAQAAASSAGSASMRVYSVGTPMNTVTSGRRAIAAFASKRLNHSILLPFSSAPCSATNRPCTWKIGSACSSTSPARQSQ